MSKRPSLFFNIGGCDASAQLPEFGLADGRTGNMKGGKRIREIRKVLREHFYMSADTIPLVEGVGHQPCFKACGSPSFRT